MKIVELVQGSPEWLAWRKGSFVADTVAARQQVIDRAVTK